MQMTYEHEDIAADQLLGQMSDHKEAGWRLCQILSADEGDSTELLYTLAKDYELKNFRLVIEEGTVVPSITGIFSYAHLYENEIAELFGVEISDIRSNLNRKLYKIHVEAPFKKGN